MTTKLANLLIKAIFLFMIAEATQMEEHYFDIAEDLHFSSLESTNTDYEIACNDALYLATCERDLSHNLTNVLDILGV